MKRFRKQIEASRSNGAKLQGTNFPVTPIENPVVADRRHDRQFERALKTFFAFREKCNPANPQPKENNDPKPNS